MRHHVRIEAALPLLVVPMLATLGCARESEALPLASTTEVQEKETRAAAPDDSVACGGNSGAPLTTYHGVPFYSNGACCLVCGSSRPGWDFSDVHGLGKDSFGWTLADMTLVSLNAAAIRLAPGASAPQLLSPSALQLNPNPAAGGYGQLHLFLRSRGVSRSLRVHFTTASDRGWDEEKAVEAPIPATPGWNDVVVDLAQNPRWVTGGRIDQIRIDPVQRRSASSYGEIIDIDWIRFDR